MLLNVIKRFYSMSGVEITKTGFLLQNVSLNLNIILFYYSGGIQVHRVICMLIYCSSSSCYRVILWTCISSWYIIQDVCKSVKLHVCSSILLDEPDLLTVWVGEGEDSSDNHFHLKDLSLSGSRTNSYFDFVLTFWENITNNARPNTVRIFIFSQNVLGNNIKKTSEWLGEGD